MFRGGWARTLAGRTTGRKPTAAIRFFILTLTGAALVACGAPLNEKFAGLETLEAPFPVVRHSAGRSALRPASLHGRDEPVPIMASISVPKRPLQCVPYARQNSRIKIRGDARTWWQQAKGRYERSGRPKIGAVLVMKPVRASRGHVAVVKDILNEREIVVDHANWLNRGQIHTGTPVRDVSPNNDWSVVRVWYTPGKRYGANRYPVHGFIDPPVTTASR